MIPVLIVPVLNRSDLLIQMLDSVDFPVEKIVIIDNGNHAVFTDMVVRPNEHIIRMPHNLGVGASWNLGMKTTPHAPWWLIVNNDIKFGPGDLAHLNALMTLDCSARIVEMLGMAAFAITARTIETVGYFDENFHPAYNEDLDYGRRAALAGVPHGNSRFTGSHVGSATIYSDERLRARNHETHSANDVYYAEKWGGSKQGGETFATPFNRGGSVADWTLDSRRLTRQAWPTESTHSS